MIARKKRKSKKSIKKTQINEPAPSNAKEKIVLVLFLMFVIVAIIVLFRAPEQTITGMSIASTQLEKTQFEIGEDLEGEVSLQLQYISQDIKDILPEQTKITILIETQETKCQEGFVCANGIKVPWYEWNEASQTCELIDPDPESECCRRYPPCRKVIIDGGFEKSGFGGSLIPYWRFDLTSATPDAVGTDFGGVANSEYSAFTNSLEYNVFPTTTEARVAIYQEIDATVSEFEKGLPVQKDVIYNSNSENYKTDLSFDSLYYLTQEKSLEWALKHDIYQTYGYGGTGCMFELVIKSVQGNNLHYYYMAPDTECNTPTSTAKEKYIALSSPLEPYEWENYSRDFYSDWVNEFGSTAANNELNKIELVSHGKRVNNIWYGQQINWDEIVFEKNSGLSAPTSCTSSGKKCCIEGAGFGDYFGEQLECTSGECWSGCTPSRESTLTQFKVLSTTKTKYNRIEGYCSYVDNGVEQELGQDYCGTGGVNKGYAACTDTSSSAPINCRNWTNSYTVNISKKLGWEVPPKNGTYALKLKVEYTPTWYPSACDPEYAPEYCEPILMHEASQTFYVGTQPAGPSCLDSDYNCTNAPILQNWSNWSSCIQGIQTKTRILYCVYVGTEACLANKNITQTETKSCGVPCDIMDYSCSAWLPELCSMGTTQTRTCDLVSTICDPADSSSIVPESEQICTVESMVQYAQNAKAQGATRTSIKQQLSGAGWSQSDIDYVLNTVYGVEEKPKLGWLIWGLVIVVLVVVVIGVFWKVILPKAKKTKQEAYPELTSYIRDALATGATRPEIIAKLQEAGWPKDAINTAFRSTK